MELGAIADYIARDAPMAAARWEARMRGAVKNVTLFPFSVRRYEPAGPRDDIRELVRGNYNIVYRVTDDAIYVLTIFEGHRLPPTPSQP